MVEKAEMEKRAAKHAPAGKAYAAKYPFSGLIVCGSCGKRISGHKKNDCSN